MSELTPRFNSSLSSQPSLWHRIRENLRSVLAASRVRLGSPLAAGTVPIHLLENGHENRYSAQAGSTALHVLGSALLFFFLAHPAVNRVVKQLSVPRIFPRLSYSAPESAPVTDASHLGKSGGGGDHNSLPPTSGDLPTYAHIRIASPRPIDVQNPRLPVITAILATDAPDFTPTVINPGMPWMNEKNNSGGAGKDGLGEGEEGGAGETGGTRAGQGHEHGPYSVAASPVSCKYCPDPLYSDEARKAKMQGHITLRVLVGADGRATDIQIAHGLGMGLDENAVSAVRNWQFIPAKDAARRPMASWITIETVFRLF